MLADDYVLLANLEYQEAKSILSVFHSDTAPPPEQVLLLWQALDGEHHLVYLSEVHFFLFCQVIDREILQNYNHSKDLFDYVCEKAWHQVQAENGMIENGKEAMRLRYCETPHYSGLPCYFALTSEGVTIHLATSSILVLPQVAGFIRQDWRAHIALTH